METGITSCDRDAALMPNVVSQQYSRPTTCFRSKTELATAERGLAKNTNFDWIHILESGREVEALLWCQWLTIFRREISILANSACMISEYFLDSLTEAAALRERFVIGTSMGRIFAAAATSAVITFTVTLFSCFITLLCEYYFLTSTTCGWCSCRFLRRNGYSHVQWQKILLKRDLRSDVIFYLLY